MTPETSLLAPGRRLASERTEPEASWLVDGVVVLFLGSVIAALAWYAIRASAPMVRTVPIDISPWALPGYALLSLMRVMLSYVLSLIYTIIYGTIAAKSPRAERVMIPILDVLQGIPVLGFLPGVGLFLIFRAFPSTNLGIELTCILMIFTAMPWNMAYSYFSSLRTIPEELEAIARIHRFTWWERFTKLELPIAMNGLVWNSMMSLAGGWFFLMILEVFRLGNTDFVLPGIGAYMSEAYRLRDWTAVAWALATMTLIVVLTDQVLWKPIVTWAQRFKFQDAEGTLPRTLVGRLIGRSRLVPTIRAAGTAVATTLTVITYQELDGAARPSWVAAQLARSRILRLIFRASVGTRRAVRRIVPPRAEPRVSPRVTAALWRSLGWTAALAALAAGAWIVYELTVLLSVVSLAEWGDIFVALFLTAIRHFAAVIIAALIMIPIGVAIGISPRVARRAQPIVQIVASFPAPMFFPIVSFGIATYLGKDHFGWACIVLTLFATQWYVLFNVIAGAIAIPQDLHEVARTYRLTRVERWRTVYLPGIMPYLMTGLFTAAGGAWNGAIVSEYQDLPPPTGPMVANGLGAMISVATNTGNHPILAASVLALVVAIVLLNRFLWSPLHRKADERYSLA